MRRMGIISGIILTPFLVLSGCGESEDGAPKAPPRLYDTTFDVEAGAQVSKDVSDTQLDAMVGLIILHGFRCDSISSARPMLLSVGFVMHCNGYRYSYNIEDRGGNWVVEVD